MKKLTTKIWVLIVSFIMAATMLVALPSTAYAATGLVTINIDDLHSSTDDYIDNSANAATESQWHFVVPEGALYLDTAYGNYRVTGTSDYKKIIISSSANNANVTFDNLYMTSFVGTLGAVALGLYADNCVVTLVGYNYIGKSSMDVLSDATITGSGSLVVNSAESYSGIYIRGNSRLTLAGSVRINSYGNLSGVRCTAGSISIGPGVYFAASGESEYGLISGSNTTIICDGEAYFVTGSTHPGLFVNDGYTLYLTGLGIVTAIGTPALYTNQPIVMGDNVALQMSNNATSSETEILTRANPDSTYQWSLDNMSTTDALTDNSITITLQPSHTGTIWLGTRPVPVCENVETGVQYVTLADGLATVADGQTLRLIDNITLSAPLDIINHRQFTFDTNKHSLDFNLNHDLRVHNGSNVSFVGCDDFIDLAGVSVYDAAQATFDADLFLKAKPLYAGEGAIRVTVNGKVVGYGSTAVKALQGSLITVTGDVTSHYGIGVTAELGGLVVVGGSIESEGDGIWATGSGTTVSVGGSINSLEGNGITATGGASVTVSGDSHGKEHGVFAADAETTVIVDGIVTSAFRGVYAEKGATVTVGEQVSSINRAVWALDSGTTVNVTGEIYSHTGTGIAAEKGATVNIRGDVSVELEGVWALDPGTSVNIGGNLGSNSVGVLAVQGATVTVNGDVFAKARGIDAREGASVSVGGNIKTGGSGVWAKRNATVNVKGDITGGDAGVYADEESIVTATGNVTGQEYFGIQAMAGSKVSVTGNAKGGICGVGAMYPETMVDVGGSSTGSVVGVQCLTGATISIGGDAKATANDVAYGVVCLGAETESESAVLTQVFVKGNVISSCYGAFAIYNGQITIDGTITAADEAIMVNNLAVAKNPTTLKAGYNQYSDTPNGALPTITAVWVKIVPVTNPTPTPNPQIPKTGDIAPYALALAFILIGVGGCAVVVSRRRKGLPQ